MTQNIQNYPKISVEEGIKTPVAMILDQTFKENKTFLGKNCDKLCLDQYVSVKDRNKKDKSI